MGVSDVAQTARQRKIELWATFSILAAIVVYLIARQIDFYNLLPWEKTVSGAKWDKSLSGHKGDVISSIAELPDGGLAVAGWSCSRCSEKPTDHRAWVVRLKKLPAKKTAK